MLAPLVSLAEHGAFPDPLLRMGIRRLVAARKRELVQGIGRVGADALAHRALVRLPRAAQPVDAVHEIRDKDVRIVRRRRLLPRSIARVERAEWYLGPVHHRRPRVPVSRAHGDQ